MRAEYDGLRVGLFCKLITCVEVQDTSIWCSCINSVYYVLVECVMPGLCTRACVYVCLQCVFFKVSIFSVSWNLVQETLNFFNLFGPVSGYQRFLSSKIIVGCQFWHFDERISCLDSVLWSAYCYQVTSDVCKSGIERSLDIVARAPMSG